MLRDSRDQREHENKTGGNWKLLKLFPAPSIFPVFFTFAFSPRLSESLEQAIPIQNSYTGQVQCLSHSRDQKFVPSLVQSAIRRSLVLR